MNKEEILYWLKQDDAAKLKSLWKQANEVRKENVGDMVHLRGLIELSNICSRKCGYCGISALNANVTRYRMTMDEIVECAKQGKELGYGTVVLQSGEDSFLNQELVTEMIYAIKKASGLAITLSLGERSREELKTWRKAGADRYLLRFETSNQELFNYIHPPAANGQVCNRIDILEQLRELNYEVGSGVMVGIPGQVWEDAVNDLLTFKKLDLDMIGIGPYIKHPATPLASKPNASRELQVPNTELMTYKMVAITRILCPKANIPSTSALATLNKKSGRELGLVRGANIIMPNLTPTCYRALYEIYPAKACIDETAEQCHNCLHVRIKTIGRILGTGDGASPNWLARQSL